MSFYLGGNSAGTNLLHLTRTTVNNVSDMQDKILPSTFFHSSLPYMTVTELRATKVAVPMYNGYTLGGNGAFTLHQDDITYLNNNMSTVYVLTVFDNSRINTESVRARFMSSGSNSTLTGVWIVPGTTTTSGRPTAQCNTYVSAQVFGSVRVFAFSTKPLVFTNNIISISPSIFSIRGVDFNKIAFLSYGLINNTDLAMFIPGSSGKQLQLIGIRSDGNARVTSPIEMAVTPDETYIAFGGSKAFTSLSGGYSSYLATDTREITVPGTDGYVTDMALPVASSDTAMGYVLISSTSSSSPFPNGLSVNIPISLNYMGDTEVFYLSTYGNKYEPYQRMTISVPSAGTLRIRTFRPNIAGMTITGYSNINVKVVVLK